MLSYLVLIAVQIAGAWFGAPQVLRYIPVSGDPRTFVHAAAFAVIVWIIGVLGSLVLKDVRQPGTGSLGLALVLSLAGAAVIVTGLIAQIPFKFAPMFLPLGGAILGYLIRR